MGFGLTTVIVNDFTLLSRCEGEEVDGVQNNCLHLALSSVLGLNASVFRSEITENLTTLVSSLGLPGSKQSLFEASVRQYLHDVKCGSQQDLNVVRFAGHEMLLPVRVFVFMVKENSVILHIFQDKDWKSKKVGHTTVTILIHHGHAEALVKYPEFCGGNRLQTDGSIKPVSNEQADVFRNWISKIGGETYMAFHVSRDEVRDQVKTIETSMLHNCPTCSEKCLIEAIPVGRVPSSVSASTVMEDTVRLVIYPEFPEFADPTLSVGKAVVFKSPLNDTGESVSFLEPGQGYPNADQKLRHTTLPPIYMQWSAYARLHGGFTPQKYGEMFKHRDEGSKFWSQMSVKKLKLHPFDPGILKLSTELLSKTRKNLLKLDRKLIQSGNEAEWENLQLAFRYLVTQSDVLLIAMQDVRAAVAIFRRAKLDVDGSLAVDGDRINSISGLLPDSYVSVLKSIADMGVPLLLLKDKPIPDVQVESHRSASLAIKEILYNTLVDAAEARVLVFTQDSKSIKGKTDGDVTHLLIATQGLPSDSHQVQNLMDKSGVIVAPLGAVDKKKADGSISEKKRLIHDLRDLNEEIFLQEAAQLAETGLETSEACTPSVLDMLRFIVVTWYCFPYCKIVLFKRDFNAAFKLVHHNLADVVRIAAVIPIVDVVLVSGSLVFGQTKSPAWFSIFAFAVVAAFTMLACPEQHLNGPTPAHADIHVDDTLCAFRLLGDNHKYYSAAYKGVSEVLLGVGSISKEKLEEEGELTDCIQAWGYIWNLKRMQWWGPSQAFISIPIAKIVKMRNLLEEIKVDDLLKRRVKLEFHQRLQGLAVYMSLCSKPLYSVLQRLFPMTATADEVWLVPWDNKDQKWFDYASGIAMLKLLVNDESYFKDSCTSSILYILSPREQVDMGVPVVYLGSDATGAGTRDGVLSAINYNEKVWTVNVISPFMQAISNQANFEEEELMVAIAEFVPIVLMVMEYGSKWSGHLVISACDNQVVVAVLRNRRSSNRVLQFLMDIVVRMEMRYKFQITSVYINTKANCLADLISRIYHDVSQEELQRQVEVLQPGLKYVEMNVLLDFLVSSVSTQLFSRALPGEEGNKDALAFMLQYEQGVAESGYTGDSNEEGVNDTYDLGTMIEVNAGLAPMSIAGKSRGFYCQALVDQSSKHSQIAMKLLDSDPLVFETTSMLEKSIIEGNSSCSHCSVLILNPTYGEENNQEMTPVRLLSLINQLQPLVVVWVRHISAATSPERIGKDWDKAMEDSGFVRVRPFSSLDQAKEVETVSLVDLGSVQHSQRSILMYERRDMASTLGSSAPLFKRSSKPLKMIDFLDDESDPSLIIHGVYHEYKHSNPSSPCIQAGHVLVGVSSGDLQEGQCVLLEGSKKWCIIVNFEKDNRIRVSEDGRRIGSQLIHRSKVKRQKPHKMIVLSIQGCANAMLAWNDRLGGIGNRLIRDDRNPTTPIVRSLSTTEVMRMSGWKQAHLDIVNESTSSWKNSEREYLIGSSTPVSLAESLVDRIASRIATWYRRQKTTTVDNDMRVGGGNNKKRQLPFEDYFRTRPLDEAVNFLKNQSISSGTSFTYEAALKPWLKFRIKEQEPVICSGPPAKSEHEICRFATTRFYIDHVSLSTIKVSLYAVRKHHVLQGLPSPLESRCQLDMVLEGIKRIEGRTKRKVPVSMVLIRSLVARLNLDSWDDLVTVTAIMVMFIFMLRSGEALKTDRNQDLTKCLRVDMVIFRCDGQTLTGPSIAQADEVLLCIGKTKADQSGQGKVINARASKNDPLCPVALLKRMHKMRGEYFSEVRTKFLFTLSNGLLVHRSRIVTLLRKEASVAGYPAYCLSVISLRSGGASAMYAAGFSGEEIKNRGRWNSNCWRNYVWAGEDLNNMVNDSLLASSFTPIAALHYFRGSDDRCPT